MTAPQIRQPVLSQKTAISTSLALYGTFAQRHRVIQLTMEHPRVADTLNKVLGHTYTSSHSTVQALLIKFGAEVTKYGFDPSSLFIYGFGPLFTQNPGLKNKENIVDLKRFGRLFIDKGIKTAKLKTYSTYLFSDCVAPLLMDNPELTRIENIKTLELILALAVKASMVLHLPDELFKKGINPLLKQNSDLMKKENIKVLELILDLAAITLGHNRDSVTIIQYGIVPLLHRNPGLAKIENIKVLQIIHDLCVKAEENKVGATCLYAEGIYPLMSNNPELERIENVKDLERLGQIVLDAGIRAVKNGVDPAGSSDSMFTFSYSMYPIFMQNPELARIENIKTLELITRPGELAKHLDKLPEIYRNVVARSTRLSTIEFEDGGNSPNTFADFAFLTLVLSPVAPAEPLPHIRKADKPGNAIKGNAGLDEILRQLGLAQGDFKQAHGRTLVYEGKEGAHYGIKLQKQGESRHELENEAAFLKYLRSNFNIPGLPEFIDLRGVVIPGHVLNKFKQYSSEEEGFRVFNKTGALFYRTTKDYFTFLSDPSLSDPQFEAASRAGLGALFTLARHHLIHTSLIELYHNLIQRGRDDRGRYLWMANIVRPMEARSGTGRLHAWQTMVKHPNLRLSGMADLAHLHTLDSLMDEENDVSVHLSNLLHFGRAATNFYLASYLGDYLLSWSLITGSRYLQRGGLNPANVTRLAEVMQWNFSYAFSVYSGVPRESAHAFLGAVVNWNMMARQMAYFMTDAYIEGLKTQMIPKGIFDSETNIHYADRVEGSRGWTDKGWAFDGKNADLGPVNGPFPIQELIKALYLSTSFMVAIRNSQAIQAV